MIYSLFDYSERVAYESKRPFVDLPYLHHLCDTVERCVTGELPDGKKNLVINIPPRHFKTTFVSQNFVSWCLSEISADCNFILTSYSAELARSNAVRVKQIISEPWHQELYSNVHIDESLRNTQEIFYTTAGGMVYATGIGGTITGFGAGNTRRGFGGAIIIDDPLNARDARSATMRKSVIEFYTGTLISRRNHIDTPIILIAQRLHPDDLCGWILENEADLWERVTFPVINDAGELLNPLTMTYRELDKLRLNDEFTYNAQYMCQPTIPGGNIIKKIWWRTYRPDALREPGIVFVTADTAYKEKDAADLSVLWAWKVTTHGLFALTARYGRWNFPRLVEEAQRFWADMVHIGARIFYIEDKASGQSLVQTLQDHGIDAEAWLPKEHSFPDDKVGRMNEAAVLIAGGNVLLPTGNIEVSVLDGNNIYVTPEAYDLVEECASFSYDNSHLHDDHCDALSMACSIYKELIIQGI